MELYKFYVNPHQTGVSESLIRGGGQMVLPLDIDQIIILFLQGLRYVYKGLEYKIKGP